MFCSSPSSSLRSQCASRSDSRGTGSTHTSPSRTSTSNEVTSSANGSNVEPPARSKRAWCQWQVRMPSRIVPWLSGKPMCGQRLSSA